MIIPVVLQITKNNRTTLESNKQVHNKSNFPLLFSLFGNIDCISIRKLLDIVVDFFLMDPVVFLPSFPRVVRML